MQPTGLLTPALHDLTLEQEQEWSRLLALCREAVKDDESHYLAGYLKLAESEGFSPVSLYSLATEIKGSRYPSAYWRFLESQAMSQEQAERDGIPYPPALDGVPPFTP